MYIRKLKLENWKNFRETETISLQRRVFLVGPNAAGKSNFLDVFRFLRDICLPGGGLQEAVRLRGGVSSLRCLSARQHPDISIEVGIGGDEAGTGSTHWRYRLALAQDNNRRPMIREEKAWKRGRKLLDRPDKDDEKDPDRKTQTALEQITANQAFRPIAEFFRSVAYQHLLPQVIREPASFTVRPVTNDPYGRDFLRRVAKTPDKTRESRLRRILQGLRVAVPQLSELRVEFDKDSVPHLIGVYEHWRPHGSLQTEAQFSDGTLRLAGILWSLFEGDGPLLMEEPEMSIHEELVRCLPQIIEKVHRSRKSNRQVIISTHSNALVADPGIGGEEVLRLEPGTEGTKVISPMQVETERALLKSGLSIADVVMPKTKPPQMEQLLIQFPE